MAKFIVTIREMVVHEVEVEANSRSEAKEIAENLVMDSSVAPSSYCESSEFVEVDARRVLFEGTLDNIPPIL